MNRFKNVMEVLTLLEKSNCRECNEKTCMVFAAKVFNGERALSECPRVADEVAHKYKQQAVTTGNSTDDIDALTIQFKKRLAEIDIAQTAERIHASFDGRKITLKILGKDFSIDVNGRLCSDIHVNAWVSAIVLSYILNCAGRALSGQWVSMRDLKQGREWERFFDHRCVKPMKRIADNYTSLFEDMVDIFNGRSTESQFQSDIAVVLYPLPLVPMMICYWKPEDGMDSDLKIFFDATADDNLGVKALYSVGAGIVAMFEKISMRHGIYAHQAD